MMIFNAQNSRFKWFNLILLAHVIMQKEMTTCHSSTIDLILKNFERKNNDARINNNTIYIIYLAINRDQAFTCCIFQQ